MEDFPDLHEELTTLYRRTGAARFIWCVPASGFSTTVSTVKGVLLGGAWSPAFLRDVTSRDHWGIPWTVTLRKVRLLLIESAKAPVLSWSPLLKGVAQAEESLLVVTEAIGGDFLNTLIANLSSDALRAAAVRVNSAVRGGVIEHDGPEVPPPASPGNLPLAAHAWVRRSATFVSLPEGAASIGSLTHVSVIAVGGDNLDHQQERLRYLVRAVEKLAEGEGGV